MHRNIYSSVVGYRHWYQRAVTWAFGLLLASDPFDQDETNQRHSALAIRYLSARNEFEVQLLNEVEQKILDHVIELNSSGYAIQQELIRLAMTEQQAEVLDLIWNTTRLADISTRQYWILHFV